MLILQQRDFVNKLRNLSQENYPRLFRWAECNHRGSYKRENRWSKSRVGRDEKSGGQDDEF